MISNNLPILVERGSFKRESQEEDRESPANNIISESICNIDPRNPTLLSSTTTLCQEPLLNISSNSLTTTTTPYSNKPYTWTYTNHKNSEFYSRSNITKYQNKFNIIQSNKKQVQSTNCLCKNTKTLHEHYKLYTNKLLSSHIEFDKLIILDWDDTLFPTSAIPRQQLRAFDRSPLFRGETKQLYYQIKSLIDIIISLFDTITSHNGQIKIVTNAGFGWLHGIFNGYFSGVIGRLFERLATNIQQNNAEIISARDQYTHKHSNKLLFDGEIAKKECMENIFRKYKHDTVPNKVPVVYCIGDSFAEFNASKTAWNKVVGNKYISILQRIKFIEQPSIELLMEEIKTVEGLIKDDTNKQFIQWIVEEKYVIDYV